MHVVRTLQRAPHRNAVPRIKHRDHPVVFDVKLLLCPGPVFPFHDVVGFCPDAFDVALFNHIHFECIVGAPDDLRAPLAFFHREDGRQNIIFNRYGIDGLRQRVAI